METCSIDQKFKFNKEESVYTKKRNTIVELCDFYEVELGNLFTYDYMITFDFEAINLILPKEESKKLEFISLQRPLSFSAISNVEGFNEVVFCWGKDPKILVENLFKYFDVVQKKAYKLMRRKLEPLLTKVKELSMSGNKHANKHAKKHFDEIHEYCMSIPIVGFNSGGYDINSMLEYGFIDEILERDSEPFIVKNGKRYKAIKTDQFIFLDEMLYCAGGTSLDKFLKCYSTSKDDEKFMFPYRWLDSYKKSKTLIKDIPIEAFDNDLKKVKCKQEDYDKFQGDCERYNLITVLDLLEFYNNRDVEPFLKACLEYKKFYYDYKLDMYKDGFTLPGLASKIMNWTSLPESLFELRNPPPSNSNRIVKIDKKRLYQYAYQDKKRNMKNKKESVICNLPSTDEIESLINNMGKKCFYCWERLDESNWSLDRIDSSENHTLENCIISCIDCNKAKSNKLFREFYRESVLKRLKVPTIYIIDEENKIVFDLMKKNIVGGPSIVFHRYHLKDETKIQRV